MPTIVLHSRTKEKISCTYGYEWSIHTFHRLKNGELVTKNRLTTKEKALEFIEKHGLVESFRTEDGQVYDTPEGDFKALFPKGIRSREDQRKIENTDNL